MLNFCRESVNRQPAYKKNPYRFAIEPSRTIWSSSALWPCPTRRKTQPMQTLHLTKEDRPDEIYFSLRQDGSVVMLGRKASISTESERALCLLESPQFCAHLTRARHGREWTIAANWPG